MSDEASTRGKKKIAMAMADPDGNVFATGLRELKSKSAANTLEVFLQILEDIDRRHDQTGSQIGKRILAAIRQTMSDRAACEKKFNELVADLINEVIPQIEESAGLLEEEDARPIIRLKHFFCSLHNLVHMADVSAAQALAAEKLHFDGKSPVHGFSKPGESGGVRAVRTSCKAFAPGADDKNGCYGKLSVFLQPTLKAKYGVNAIPITPFYGHRFNVLFFNSAAIYCLIPSLLEFLSTNPLNGLTASVYHDLQNFQYVAQIRAFAVMDKLYMGPFQRLVEDRKVGIFEMGQFYRKLIHGLEDAAQKPNVLLEGVYQQKCFSAA